MPAAAMSPVQTAYCLARASYDAAIAELAGQLAQHRVRAIHAVGEVHPVADAHVVDHHQRGDQAGMDAAAIGAISVAELKAPVANLRAQSDLVVSALDALFGAY